MKSPLGFGGVILHYNQLDCLGLVAGGLDCPTLFFNFAMGLLEEEVKLHNKR